MCYTNALFVRQSSLGTNDRQNCIQGSIDTRYFRRIQKMISDVRLESIDSSSRFIEIQRARFKKDDGCDICVEFPKVHDSVSILLYHVDRRSLIVVKQFRPAVFLNRIFPLMTSSEEEDSASKIDLSGGPASIGVTYELCDGLIDDHKLSAMETARKEILEEAGYDVPLDKIELVTKYRSLDSGAEQTIFYAAVNNTMKVSNGGGNVEENEAIELAYIPVESARSYLVEDEKIQRAPDLMFAVLWFLQYKVKI